ncbi:MerR family transcriptional regulator [Sphingomonas ursincola]|uniref:MerR family transcriptional regulator n=1 Tax=Blastomonas TaxID=150203 RepID=UPI000AB928FB|nr:MerR family transcriptional regulator [Sphingomonas ursincola]MCH2239212.1 MerR family transcriptional regulator [Blastomonas sp.]
MTDPVTSSGKAEGAMRTIGEVSAELGVKPHILRYWEAQFDSIKPLKRAGGRRYYRPEDVETLRTIDRLLNREGFTVRGARQYLAGKAAKPAPAAAPAPAVTAAHSIDLAALRAIRDRLAAALEAA